MFNKIVDAVQPDATISNIDEKSSINANTERLFFLDAPGGTTKTFVTSAIQRFLNCKEKNVVTVASFAVAAQLIDDGCTAHFALQIPIPMGQDSTCTVSADSPLADTKRKIDLLI